MRDTIPLLRRMVRSLPDHAEELNKVELRGSRTGTCTVPTCSNYDPDSGAITAVLDWEFLGVAPFPRWNPSRAFLWNARDDAYSGDEKKRCLDLFESRCAEKGVRILEDAAFASPLQESMQTVIS